MILVGDERRLVAREALLRLLTEIEEVMGDKPELTTLRSDATRTALTGYVRRAQPDRR